MAEYIDRISKTVKAEKERMTVTPKTPPQIGWLDIRLPKSVMERLQEYIEVARKDPTIYNAELVGNISKSLVLKDKDDWFFKNILASLIGEFCKTWPAYTKEIAILTKPAPYCLDAFWVNFQKQHEFNPPHNHSGVFSFVVWVKIPTDWREQHALPISANSNDPRASDFQFQYTTIMGGIESYRYFLDKEAEGGMLLFPAKLNHTVYPFYNCDKERISISGNIFFNTSAN